MREAPSEALPPRVMKQVWESALSGDLPAYTLNAVLFHVVEAAMAPPHYASVGEIAAALGVTVNKITPFALTVKQQARKGR